MAAFFHSIYLFFAPLTEPVGAIWLLMALGVAWFLWRRQWWGAIGLGLPTILLFIVGSTSVPEKLAAAQERPWTGELKISPQWQGGPGEAPADAVVALGGGDRFSRHDLLGFALEDKASRILTALQLVRWGRARTLVLGGSWPMPDKAEVPSVQAVQDWVKAWGLTEGAVTNLGICFNTHDEAVAFAKLARGRGWSKVTLVTSALHMRRSVALFRGPSNVQPLALRCPPPPKDSATSATSCMRRLAGGSIGPEDGYESHQRRDTPLEGREGMRNWKEGTQHERLSQ